MTFGLKIVNPSGEVVLSSDTYFPVYLGRATLVSTTQPTAVGSSSTGTGTGGSSTLTFTYAGQIVPVLGLPAGRNGMILGCSRSGSTWTIRVSHSDGASITDITSPAFQMLVQSTPTVYVFGFPTSIGGTFGGAIWDAAGNLIGDLTRQPLFVRQRLLLASGASTATVLPLTSPGIVGRSTDTDILGAPTAIPEVLRFLYRNSIFSIAGTTLTRTFDRRLLKNAATGTSPDIGGRLDKLPLFLVECAGLP